MPTDKGNDLARYNHAVRWIAYNDNDAEMDLSAIEEYVTVALVADVFGVAVSQIARAVYQLRRSEL